MVTKPEMSVAHDLGLKEAIEFIAELFHLLPRCHWICVVYSTNPRNTWKLSVNRILEVSRSGEPTPRSWHWLCACWHALRNLPSDEEDGKESEPNPEGHSKILENAHRDDSTNVQLYCWTLLENEGHQVGGGSLRKGNAHSQALRVFIWNTRCRSWNSGPFRLAA